MATYDGSYQIKRCRVCGLTYTATRPTEGGAETDYEHEYIPSTAVLEEHFGSRRRGAFERAAAAVAYQRPQGGTILDVGAAGGMMLDLLDDAYWKKVALEPSSVGAARLRQQPELEVIEDFYPSSQLEGRTFDVITMMDVIMVMPDPVSALRAARRQVIDGGLLAVEIPGYLYRALLHIGPVPLLTKGRWTDLNAAVHLHFLSDSTMRRMLEAAGFQVDQVLALPSSLRQGMSGAGQKWVGAVAERLPGIRHGRPSLVPKYLYFATAA